MMKVAKGKQKQQKKDKQESSDAEANKSDQILNG